jgi:hypothetical protein
MLCADSQRRPRARLPYFAFGEHDFIWIADFPDNITAAAAAVPVACSGMVKSQATSLLTVEEMDAALKKHFDYRPPGASGTPSAGTAPTRTR